MKTGLFHISEVLPVALSEFAAVFSGPAAPSVSEWKPASFPGDPGAQSKRPSSMNGLLLSVMHRMLPLR
jgi:hypothetical protein